MDKHDLIGTTQTMGLLKGQWPLLVEDSLTIVPQGDATLPETNAQVVSTGTLLSNAASVASAMKYFSGQSALGVVPPIGYHKTLSYAVTAGETKQISLPYGTYKAEVTFMNSDETPGNVAQICKFGYGAGSIAAKELIPFTSDKQYIVEDSLVYDQNGETIEVYSSAAGYIQVTLTMVIPYVAPPAPHVFETPLAAVASSGVGAQGLTIDGDTDTYWFSDNTDPGTNIVFELANSVEIYGIKTWLGNEHVDHTFDILVSENNVDWTTVATAQSFVTQGAWHTISFNGIVGKYVKLAFTAPHFGAVMYELYEIQVERQG